MSDKTYLKYNMTSCECVCEQNLESVRIDFSLDEKRKVSFVVFFYVSRRQLIL